MLAILSLGKVNVLIELTKLFELLYYFVTIGIPYELELS